MVLTRGEGSKIPKILLTSFMYGPKDPMSHNHQWTLYPVQVRRNSPHSDDNSSAVVRQDCCGAAAVYERL